MEHGPLNWRDRGALWVRIGIRVALVVAAVLLLRYAAPPLLSLLGPFVLALIVAWLLNPLVRWLHRRLSISRNAISLVLIVLIFCAIGGALFGLGYMAVDQIRSLIDNWPSVMETLANTVDGVAAWLGGFQDLLPEGLLSTGEGLVESLGRWLESLDISGWLAALAGQAPSLVSWVSSFAISTVVFIMASYFITADYPHLRFLITDRTPTEARGFCATVKRLFVQAFGGYLKSQLLLSLVVFLILAVLAAPIALPLAAALGAVAIALAVAALSVALVLMAVIVGVLVTGIALVALGVSALALYPPAALVVLGAGLVCCGMGLFGVMPVVRLIQPMFRGLANLFRKAFSRRKTA